MSNKEKEKPKHISLRASFPVLREKKSKPKKERKTDRLGEDARPFSIRLTREEKSLLLQRAGRLPLGTYIRDHILSPEDQAKRARGTILVKDHEALARVLAALGQSRIANNLNQLARAVNIGALPVSPEVQEDISEACAAVAAMRHHLIQALGLIEGDRR